MVRTKRLFGPVDITSSISTVYTCPAGKTALFKMMIFTDQGATGAKVRIFINGTALANRVLLIQGIASDSQFFNLSFFVLHPADTLRMQLAVAATYTATGFGAELDGVAP